MKKLFLLLASFFFVYGCTIQNIVKGSSDQDDAEIQQQITNYMFSLQDFKDYILHNGDLLEVRIYDEGEMDRTLRISSKGIICLPMIGDMELAGLTVADAEKKIADKLLHYMNYPSVSILVKEYSNKNVYVLGQVRLPAAVPITPGKALTLLEAIASAGGFTDVAASGRVKVLRMEDGVQKSIKIDVTQITKKGNKFLDMVLQPGDVVFVPQSFF